MRSKLFDTIAGLDHNNINLVATVIDESYLGEKIVLSDGQIVYNSKDNGFFASHWLELREINESKMTVIDNTRIFCEVIGREEKLVICGGGHISIPLIQIGKMTGFHVALLEDRPDFADAARVAGANEVICDEFGKGLTKIEGDKDTFFVIVTRGHRYDQVCLEAVIAKENAYIGMIGSKLRVGKVKQSLIENGYPEEKLEKVYTPIGLKIKAETPPEIAVSIMAEIIQVKNMKQRMEGYTKEIMNEIMKNNQQMGIVMATIVSRRGPAPRQAGTKMLICEDGRFIGTIGGGCVEAEVRQKALWVMLSDLPCLYTVDMTGREADVEEEGMVCGGIIEILLEVV